MTKNRAVVTGMPHTSVTPDGSFAEMKLTYANGTSQSLCFSPKTFFDLLSKTFQLLVNQHIQTAAAQGYAEVQPISVVVTSAQEAVGGKAVILSLRMDNGLPATFAIQPTEAAELYRQLGEAIKKSLSQSASSRH